MDGSARLLDKPSSAAAPSPEWARAEAPASVCAIVIAFNPPPLLYDNILALKDQVATVLVVDNGSSRESDAVLERIRGLPAVRIIHNHTNLGIGAALNVGVRWALERGYPWVATFDQDSRAGPGFVADLLRAYWEYPDREAIGLVAPRYREQSSGFAHDDMVDDGSSRIVMTTMMSGNLVRTDVIAWVGFYNEPFFIDYVDNEFCLRLAHHGYRVLKSSRSILEHNLGQMSQARVAGRLLATTNHSALRRYYNARNRVLVYRRYARSVPRWVARDLKLFLIDTVKIPFLERDRKAKLMSVAKGIWHGLRGKQGPVETT